MDIYFTSFLLYAIPVNLLAITIMIMGKRKLQVEWLPIEYFFIYLPWLAFIALATTVFGSLDQVPGHSSLRTFIMILQSIASGLMGGLVLLPRVIARSKKWKPLYITGLSALVVSLLYVKFRVLLFIAVAAL